ncbi:MAG: cytochrome c-type biogenesis protein [Pseudomonadota bacterium]
MSILRILVAALALFTATAAYAVQPDEILKDPALEARARALSKELRCMVCQNQSIDDSDAPLARDLRILVRERLVAGDSDEKVLAFLTDRYGAFVLLKPQFNAETAVLWLAPLIVLLAGGIGLTMFLRRRRVAMPTAASEGDKLTAAEQARITELMGQAEK